MKKVIFGSFLLVAALTGCSPSNYFLVNSDSIIKYDRIHGTFELIWHWNAKSVRNDSVSVEPDSLVIPLRVKSYE